MAFTTCTLSVILILASLPWHASCQKNDQLKMAEEAAGKLIQFYADSTGGTVDGLTAQDFASFLQSVTQHSRDYIEFVSGDCESNLTSCDWKAECPGVKEIYNTFSSDDKLHADELVVALPVALNTLSSETCTRGAHETMFHKREKTKPSQAQAWGYGIGFVTVVAIISNIGVCMGPIMHKRYFKRLLQFLVAMGAGSLAATGLLVLIPESFDIMSVEELGDAYVWKSTVAIFSIYIFFSSERFLKTFLHKRNKKNRDLSLPENGGKELLARENDHGHSHSLTDGLSLDEQTSRTTLAWMVMAGDVIHNFVDGLAIGAGFTEDLNVGISVSLAVLCEELPHELADIAILLHSGLSMKKAVCINFLSACVCYLGLIIGILLGSNISQASRWIFAVAGGLFLYVPLVDMLPEMSSQLDSLMARGGSEAKVMAALHICGLIIGALVIVFIVNISGYIEV
ncbi:metal cation symporter ZIP14 [Aplysia californica]|uniref:Metal cation symporter ZIP14 n=1 Tax=Aplysia californica TaxID=6500 RepID=A0ABM1VRI3_APLCA|nr:metal cation symporter ZIP14 [Aplysia californica]